MVLLYLSAASQDRTEFFGVSSQRHNHTGSSSNVPPTEYSITQLAGECKKILVGFTKKAEKVFGFPRVNLNVFNLYGLIRKV